jgi:hypothetical protein
MKNRLLTLKQASKEPGIYQLINDAGVFNCHLLSKIDDDGKLTDAMAAIHEGGLVALVVIPQPTTPQENSAC